MAHALLVEALEARVPAYSKQILLQISLEIPLAIPMVLLRIVQIFQLLRNPLKNYDGLQVSRELMSSGGPIPRITIAYSIMR